MQINACKVYDTNDFLGTYQETSGAFEYMTYGQFAERVDRCRTVLKDLGTSHENETIIFTTELVEINFFYINSF